MKKLILLFLFVSAWQFQTQALNPEAPAPLYRHLVEINREWLHQAVASDFPVTAVFVNDQARIGTHLRLVEQTLRQRDVLSLDALQQGKRLHHLNVLRQYRQAGIFPTNHYHNIRQPYFRDNFGVLCAVGYLLWQDGQRELVDRINRENNYGYIAELAVQYPEIGAWAQKNGFTQEELAWIQPAYEPKPLTIVSWGNGGGLNPGGRVNVMKKDAADTRLFVAGHFSEIDGFAANNIVEWDGTNWKSMGNGVVGEVYALEYFKNGAKEKLFVAGDFHLFGNPTPCNVAEYDVVSKTWKALQSGDMMGKVYTLATYPYYGNLYVGGDFQKVNGMPVKNLAIYTHYNQTWNSSPQNAGFSVDGPVSSIIPLWPHLLIGGAFKHVYQIKDSAWVDAPHLAYYDWNWNSWIPLQHQIPAVQSMAYFNGTVYTGHKLYFDSLQNEYTGTNMLKAGLWFSQPFYPAADSSIHGFVDIGGRLLTYGGFLKYEFTFGWGAAVFEKDYTDCTAYLLADSTIRAMETFRGHVYVAGDFNTLFYEPSFPGLARIQLPSVATNEMDAGIPVQVVATPDQLRLRYESLDQTTQLNIFDLQGRLLAREYLDLSAGELTLPADNVWADGLYVWQLQNNAGRSAGKWVISR